MDQENPNDKIIEIFRSRITFAAAAGFTEDEKADIVKSLCNSLKIILEWNVSCFLQCEISYSHINSFHRPRTTPMPHLKPLNSSLCFSAWELVLWAEAITISTYASPKTSREWELQAPVMEKSFQTLKLSGSI